MHGKIYQLSQEITTLKTEKHTCEAAKKAISDATKKLATGYDRLGTASKNLPIYYSGKQLNKISSNINGARGECGEYIEKLSTAKDEINKKIDQMEKRIEEAERERRLLQWELKQNGF